MGTQQDAAAIAAAIADPVPRIVATPNTTLELVCGIFNEATKEWETTAVVKELTGEDEEALAALDANDDLLYAQYMSALLKRSVVTIGNTKVSDKPDVIDSQMR